MGHYAYLRRGLGDGGPRCGPAGRLWFMVHSYLRGGSRGAIRWRGRALVPFRRGVVTGGQERRGSPMQGATAEDEWTQAPARGCLHTWVPEATPGLTPVPV